MTAALWYLKQVPTWYNRSVPVRRECVGSQETIYLLRSPANARRLMEAVFRDKSGQATVVKTMEELDALAGE